MQDEGVAPGIPGRPPANRRGGPGWVVQGIGWLLVLAAGAWVVWERERAAPERSADADVIQQYAQGQRTSVEEFSGVLLDGSRFESTELAGEVVVYNVWGSWCVPCRREAPELIEVAERMEAKVRFVGINVRDSVAAAQAFERRLGVPYPSLRSGSSDQAFLAFDGVLTGAAVPTTVVVDSRGQVAARVVGPTTAPTLTALLGDVLAADDRDDPQGQSPKSR